MDTKAPLTTSTMESNVHVVPERCEDLWYEDGTVILQSGMKQFRVYRGILSFHSSVFSAMFSFPQPPAEVVVEGCPLVHMPDSPSDLYYFLKTLHDAGYFNENAADLAVVSGVLRLSAKYDVVYFKRQALENLAPLFPTSLTAWDKLNRDKYHTIDGSSWSFTIVQLFRDTGLVALLPAALYSACFPPGGLADIINGVTRKDGTHDELSSVDKALCITARERLLLAQRELLPGALLPMPASCETRDKCNVARLLSLRDLADSENVQHAPSHTFCRTRFEVMTAFRNLACTFCKGSVSASFDRIRLRVWDELPEIFGLPNWVELRINSEMDPGV